MSNLRENLQYLRAQRGMSQSQLAARLDVSRQSVAKWESEKSYPEMGKLIKICEIFGCSMDDLVRGSLASAESPIGSGAAGDPTEAPASGALPQGAGEPPAVEGCPWADFDAFVRARARMLALSAFLLVGGLSAEFFAEAVQTDLTGGVNQLGPMLLLVCLAFSAVLGFSARRARAAFIAANASILDPTDEERAAGARRKGSVYLSLVLAAAVVLVPSFVPGLDGESAYASAAYWLAAACAAGLIVNSWVRAGALDVGRYNRMVKRVAAKG